MGKSRSATLLIAYLLSTHPDLNPSVALAQIRQCRRFAEPNSGFIDQLTLYHDMKCPSTQEALDAHPLYQRWLYQRVVEASVAAGVAPEVGDLRFGDEGNSGPMNLAAEEGAAGAKEVQPEPLISYRCRRCRAPLATSVYLVPHTPSQGSTPCSHLHLTPLSWMRPELEQGKLEGRLECPNQKCGQSVGRYAWQGMKCSCGEWVVPGMTLGRSRIDEVRERPRGLVGGQKI